LLLHREINTYFRRLAWSPDGSFMVVPCGQYKEGSTKDGKVAAVAYVYARSHLGSPVACLPTYPIGKGDPAVAVR
jgi:chromatin assembly factor 1 subunit B